MPEQPADPSGSVPSEAFEIREPDVLDAFFDALSNQRRRHALGCLEEYGDPMALADLADEVAVREYGSALPEIPAEDVKRIYISLYHNHVPKLEEAGVVEYSQNRDLVQLTSEGTVLDEYVESLS